MVTLKNRTEVKASKEHRCSYCNSRIAAGMTYHTSTHKYDGEVYTWKAHLYCSAVADHLEMFQYAYEGGVTSDDFQENIYHEYFDIILKKFEPEDAKKYSDVIQEFRKVNFHDKLMFVIRHHKLFSK